MNHDPTKGPMGQTLFATTDPMGRPAFLTDDRWQHVADNHPEMVGHQYSVRNTIERSHVIKKSLEWPDRSVYFRKGAHNGLPHLFVKVIVDHTKGGEIITAYPTDDTVRGTGGVEYVSYDNRPS